MSTSEWYDSLTELYNRQGILDVLRNLFNGAQRYKQDLSISILDIDYLNAVNERYGQFIGDSVIESVAKIIYRNIRASDTVGRYGGDEFLIILPRANLYSARVSAERIQNTIENTEMNDSANNHFSITVSQGLSCLEMSDDIRTFLVRAEEALQRAKQNGGNRVEM